MDRPSCTSKETPFLVFIMYYTLILNFGELIIPLIVDFQFSHNLDHTGYDNTTEKKTEDVLNFDVVNVLYQME